MNIDHFSNLRPPPRLLIPPPPPPQRVSSLPPISTPPPPPQTTPRSSPFSQRPAPIPTQAHSKLAELAQILEHNQIQEIHGLQIFVRNLNQKQFHEALQENHWIEQTKIEFVENLMLLGQVKLQSLRLLSSINTATVLSKTE